MQEYTITPFNTGTVTSSKANYLYHSSTHKYYDVEGTAYLPTCCFLVQGGGKKILVDTGMAPSAIADKYHHPGSMQDEEHGVSIIENLAKLNIAPEEITDIIYTHLHWDHVWYTEKFTNAKLYVQKKEYLFALDPNPLYYKSYESPKLNIEPRIEPQWKGRQFTLLEGDVDVMDGISVYFTPGHSVGHQVVVVHTKDGDYHLCGDLIFTFDNLKPIPEIDYPITPPSRYISLLEEWDSIIKLQQRAKDIEHILPAHAPEMLDIVKSGKVFGA